MKKAFRFSIVLFSIFVLFICCNNVSSQEKRQQKIDAYVESMNSDPTYLDEKKADTLINLFNDYIKDYPQDSNSETYLFYMSQVYANMKECGKALNCLDRIIKEYPKGKKVGAAYFFKGVYLKDVCLNTAKSVEAFKVYIQKFPNSKQIETAKKMLEMDTMKDETKILNHITTN